MRPFVVLSLDDQRYALPLATVERVVRVVEATPLPKAPEIVIGIINVQGRLLPVVDIRRRLRKPGRDILLSDQLIIVRTARRSVALAVDTVTGIADYPDEDLVKAEAIIPGMNYVTGAIRLMDGVILILDLDAFLSIDDERTLDDAMAQASMMDDSIV